MLKETALINVHRESGGKLVDFGGWNMPVNYGSQIDEHNAVRQQAGMFDVSHMTIVDVEGAEAQPFLQKLLANDVAKLKVEGKALYSGMLNEEAGVIDDLIVYLMEYGYRLVVNCATREKDLAWINQKAKCFDVTVIERPQLAMIAVQGPEARAKADSLLVGEGLDELKVFQGCEASFNDEIVFVARTGYTGEDGYEIIVPEFLAADLWQALEKDGVKPCGLGARDTLRLEAGMNLYGHEMDESINPLFANMGWTIAWDESRDFIGKAALEKIKNGVERQKLVGLKLTGKGILRAEQDVVVDGKIVGVTTSGSFSPTLGHSIALARVDSSIGETCAVQVRNKLLEVEVVAPVFVRKGKAV